MEWRPLQRRCARPVGRPPKKPVVRYHGFMYRGASWGRERRVVAKVEGHQGEWFGSSGISGEGPARKRAGEAVTPLCRTA